MEFVARVPWIAKMGQQNEVAREGRCMAVEPKLLDMVIGVAVATMRCYKALD